MKKYLIAIMLPLFLFAVEAKAFFNPPTPTGNATGYAWSESLGWFDFSPVTVSDLGLTGYAYNDNTGWLLFGEEPTMVTNSNGTLDGYAWSESVGWFDFNDVSINSGAFSGYAYNDNTGWLSFEDGTNVTTTWAPAVPEEETPQEETRSSRSGSRKRVITPPQTTPNTNTPNTIPNINTPNKPPFNLTNDLSNNPRDLEQGIEGDDVKKLQQFLNSIGFIVNPNPGQAGSIGYETNYFGNLTRQALIKFQIANNINPPAGYFGPITRAFIRSLLTN